MTEKEDERPRGLSRRRSCPIDPAGKEDKKGVREEEVQRGGEE